MADESKRKNDGSAHFQLEEAHYEAHEGSEAGQGSSRGDRGNREADGDARKHAGMRNLRRMTSETKRKGGRDGGMEG